MAPFSVSTLKEKASLVKSASVRTYGSAREKISSSASPSASRAKPPPPPPPARKASSSQRGDFLAPRARSGSTDLETIDWANLSDEDKQAFFAWLDEFFARYLGTPVPTTAPPAVHLSAENQRNYASSPSPSPRASPSLPPRRVSSRASQNTGPDPVDVLAPAQAQATSESPAGRRNLPPAFSQQGPPKIKYSTKPSGPTEVPEQPPWSSATTGGPSSSTDPTIDLQMSFPPPTANGSAAADLAAYMHPSTPWDSEWYTTTSPIPPHLDGSPEIRFTGSYGYSGAQHTARGAILFSDLSMCWYSVTYTKGRGPAPSRWARYRPRPAPMPAPALRHAAETYGAAVAAFAEGAVASGRPVGRGECWDVAHEALLHAEALFGERDAPLLSTSRAHGHLLLCGKPGVGQWRGGDDRLRKGDVVEWRTVRIGGEYGAYAILGEPDHTAVLVEDTVPRCAVADGESVRPADVGVLTVVEQSAGRAPQRESYDLGKLQQGEFWVYRPVGMVEYLGSKLSVDMPSGLETFAV